MDVGDMQAGPELDEAIATEVMRWSIYDGSAHRVGDRPYPHCYRYRDRIMVHDGSADNEDFRWRPSTDPAVMMQLLAKLGETSHVTIKTPFTAGDSHWCGISPLGVTGWNGRPDINASGGTLTLCVARAALK